MGARAFCERYGDGAAWTGLPLEDQLALNPKIERFAAWLIATRRLRPSAEYLVARRPRLGALIAR